MQNEALPVTVGLVGLWIAAALTLVTGYDYLKTGLKYLTAHEPNLAEEQAEEGEEQHDEAEPERPREAWAWGRQPPHPHPLPPQSTPRGPQGRGELPSPFPLSPLSPPSLLPFFSIVHPHFPPPIPLNYFIF